MWMGLPSSMDKAGPQHASNEETSLMSSSMEIAKYVLMSQSMARDKDIEMAENERPNDGAEMASGIGVELKTDARKCPNLICIKSSYTVMHCNRPLAY